MSIIHLLLYPWLEMIDQYYTSSIYSENNSYAGVIKDQVRPREDAVFKYCSLNV